MSSFAGECDHPDAGAPNEPPVRRTSKLAVLSLVLCGFACAALLAGVLSSWDVAIVVGLLAVIVSFLLGLVSRVRIRRRNDLQGLGPATVSMLTSVGAFILAGLLLPAT